MNDKLLAKAIGDSVVSLGIRESAKDVEDELEYLLKEPLDLFLMHPNWPSGLTLSGIPIEISLAISSDGSPSIRYVVDITNHREGLAGNWNRYIEYTTAIIGKDQSSQLWRLHAKHLDGISPLFRSRMFHGVDYGPNGFKCATIFFSYKNWIPYLKLEKQFPSFASAIDKSLNQYNGHHPPYVDIISYDFTSNGEIASNKFYGFLDYNNQKKQFSDVASCHPDLEFAGKVFEKFQAVSFAHKTERSLMIQFSLDPYTEVCRQKIHFPCVPWGWNNSRGLFDLVAYLSNTFNLNLWPLYVVLGIFSEYKIPLKPSWIGIGPGNFNPSVSFYFYPQLEQKPDIRIKNEMYLQNIDHNETNGIATISKKSKIPLHLELIDEMLNRAIEYIISTKEEDGHWIDFDLPQGKSDEWVTAYIVSILSNDMCKDSQIRISEWLHKRFRPGKGWSYNRKTKTDADSTALGFLALHRLGATLPEDPYETLLQYRLPSGGYHAYIDWDLDIEHGIGSAEITSLVLLAHIETGLQNFDIICDTVANLISQQRDEGGWNAFWWKDDLFATYRTILALNAFVQFATSGKETARLPINLVQSANNALKGARPSISAHAVSNEPFILGLWLSSWFAAQGNVHYPSVDRILYNLYSQQQEDGKWLSSPIKRIAKTKLLRPWARSDSGCLYLDSQCLITTTTVIEGLKSLRQALILKD